MPFFDICSDEHISQRLDAALRNSEVCQIMSERMKERSDRCSVQLVLVEITKHPV